MLISLQWGGTAQISPDRWRLVFGTRLPQTNCQNIWESYRVYALRLNTDKMPLCCAYDCKNIGVHRFPNDKKCLQSWIKAIRRKNWKPTPTSRLCSKHFKPNDYYEESKYTGVKLERKVLKKGAIPSIFSFSKCENQSKSRRLLRYETRCKEIELLDFSDLECDTIPDVAVNVVIESEEPQTENVSDDLSNLVEYADKCTQINVEHIYGSVLRFQNDDKAIQFYTGFDSYKKLLLVYSTLRPMVPKIYYYTHNILNMSYLDQFFMTLMKLRQNKTNFELSRFFNISTSTVSNIFITWMNFIYQMWNKLDIWPNRELVDFYMPQSFKKYDKTVRVILDGTEFPVQKPENTLAQQASWSNYKHGNTLKVLVGATPGGLLSYCSPAYGGSTSDRQAIERSSLFDKCESGDTILADRGFNVQDMFIIKNVTVRTPAFLRGKDQLPGLTVLHDRQLASKRVHIERLIGLTKTYKILKSELDHSYIPLASKIFYVCLMCCNFREGIMK